MYKIGNKVLYGSHGICEILGTEVRRINRQNIEYYILMPLDQPGTRFYIPTENKAALSKLQPILTADQINVLLREGFDQTNVWIADESQRKQRYKELISSGDRAALIKMVHALYRHREEQMTVGRKFHLCDENFLRDAERLLGAEFSFVLGIPQNAVGEYVSNVIKENMTL